MSENTLLSDCVTRNEGLSRELKAARVTEQVMLQQAGQRSLELDKWRSLAGELVEALMAERQMRKASPPKKLIEELCWRENDALANKMAETALAKAKEMGL